MSSDEEDPVELPEEDPVEIFEEYPNETSSSTLLRNDSGDVPSQGESMASEPSVTSANRYIEERLSPQSAGFAVNQRGLTVEQYTREFELVRWEYPETAKDETAEERVRLYIEGLRPEIKIQMGKWSREKIWFVVAREAGYVERIVSVN